MFQIRLFIMETDGDGRSLRKNVYWPIVPRLNELLSVQGNTYTVVDVLHRIDEGPAVIEVSAEGPEHDFRGLSTDPSWEQMGF